MAEKEIHITLTKVELLSVLTALNHVSKFWDKEYARAAKEKNGNDIARIRTIKRAIGDVKTKLKNGWSDMEPRELIGGTIFDSPSLYPEKVKLSSLYGEMKK